MSTGPRYEEAFKRTLVERCHNGKTGLLSSRSAAGPSDPVHPQGFRIEGSVDSHPAAAGSAIFLVPEYTEDEGSKEALPGEPEKGY